MKKLILPVFVFLSMSAFAQINQMVKATKVSKVNTRALDPGIGPTGVFPIISGQVSATPISIPSQNNQPVRLTPTTDQFTTFSNIPKSLISACSLVNYRDQKLRVHISYTIHTDNDKPIWAGAWFYDKNNNAADVGYIPQKINKKPTGDIEIIMKFNKYPVTTEYLKVMLLQDGKEIATRSFKAVYLWKGDENTVNKYANIMSAAEISTTGMIKTTDAVPYIPDLEITAVKVLDTDNNTLPYESGCSLKNKMIFISNTGTKESSPYILSVGYIKYKGNRGIYAEVKRFSMPSLLPGKQTSRTVILPGEANNIRAEIIYNYNPGGETNYSNNSIELQCRKIR